MRRTFQTWGVTGDRRRRVLPALCSTNRTLQLFNLTSGEQARLSSCLPSVTTRGRGQGERDGTKETRFCNTCSRVPANIPWSSGLLVMHSINPCDQLQQRLKCHLNQTPEGEVVVTSQLWKCDLSPGDYYINKDSSVGLIREDGRSQGVKEVNEKETRL